MLTEREVIDLREVVVSACASSSLATLSGARGAPSCSTGCPSLIADWKLDLVVINGENAAGGFGITEAIYNELIEAGADAITLGNHAWDQREALVFIERAPRLIRPANYPAGTPGRGAAMIDTKNGKRALVINAMGRIFMDPLDDPFAVVERELAACALGKGADAIVLDMHCEATSEKQAMGYFCDGRVSLVVGTHTHAPTADHRILAGGTAFISDVGMTGDFDSVIGMAKDEPLNRFLRKISTSKFEPATGAATLCAHRGGDRRRQRACQTKSARCASAVCWNRRCRIFGFRLLLRLTSRTPDDSVVTVDSPARAASGLSDCSTVEMALHVESNLALTPTPDLARWSAPQALEPAHDERAAIRRAIHPRWRARARAQLRRAWRCGASCRTAAATRAAT